MVVTGSHIKGAKINEALAVSVFSAEDVELLGIESGEDGIGFRHCLDASLLGAGFRVHHGLSFLSSRGSFELRAFLWRKRSEFFFQFRLPTSFFLGLIG